MKILIDNGHGLNTPGKRSSDGKFREAIYTREIARRLVADLMDRGYDAELLVPETEDISLEDRVSRVNAHCRALGKSNVILVSIHVNAAGNGSKWLNATGWSCYTCKGETQSDKLANCLYDAVKNTSMIVKSAPTTPLTEIPIGKKIFIFSVNLIAWQYCQRTFSWILYLIWSICRAYQECNLS